MTRPTLRDVDIKPTAERLAKELMTYESDLDFEDLADDIAKAIKSNIYGDGYDITKQLDDYGYSVSTQWVEVLDGFDWELRDAHKLLVEKWVADNDIKPTVELGQEYTTYISRIGQVTGKVTQLREKTAEFILSIPGKHEDGNGYVLKYEDVK